VANIKSKSIEELETWNSKELRKLRMVIQNRIKTLESTTNPKKQTPHCTISYISLQEQQ